MAKNRLGKGLSALIPKNKTVSSEKEIINLKISEIYPNKDQPRKIFDQEKISVLSESIKNYGILQPIVVKKEEEGYMIIAGERRFRAAKMAKLKEMPAVVKDLPIKDIMEIALIENLQREDLNAIEEAIAYKSLIENYKVTQEEISEAVGKSRPHITNTLRLLNLDDRVIKLIEEGQITPGHGKALLRIENKNIQYEIALRIIKETLSVREVENLSKNMTDKKQQKSKNINKDPFIVNIEDKLRDVFGTKVNILKGKKKGKIEIEYYSDEELEGILEQIL
ncbi:MAG: ParB/RepB/Spo0J family partition protein [Tepidibacter sp.]|jgi:ParB family chromosome partitioning protein|uniref:ParB/RepB/Spo0J family partition protein n=1 Tax=Tepidibacter sp. TaxID=2529387 RepID=UPI0025FE1883|nr:ParB/RepB/Spo0J family partition protein [Tepidibacter sp.]MCT4507243.1 ParB/RepB/Spo0J family partition protein [Tepidibacter sp.]